MFLFKLKILKLKKKNKFFLKKLRKTKNLKRNKLKGVFTIYKPSSKVKLQKKKKNTYNFISYNIGFFFKKPINFNYNLLEKRNLKKMYKKFLKKNLNFNDYPLFILKKKLKKKRININKKINYMKLMYKDYTNDAISNLKYKQLSFIESLFRITINKYEKKSKIKKRFTRELFFYTELKKKKINFSKTTFDSTILNSIFSKFRYIFYFDDKILSIFKNYSSLLNSVFKRITRIKNFTDINSPVVVLNKYYEPFILECKNLILYPYNDKWFRDFPAYFKDSLIQPFLEETKFSILYDKKYDNIYKKKSEISFTFFIIEMIIMTI